MQGLYTRGPCCIPLAVLKFENEKGLLVDVLAPENEKKMVDPRKSSGFLRQLQDAGIMIDDSIKLTDKLMNAARNKTHFAEIIKEEFYGKDQELNERGSYRQQPVASMRETTATQAMTAREMKLKEIEEENKRIAAAKERSIKKRTGKENKPKT